MLGSLDSPGDGISKIFDDRFAITLADLIGDFIVDMQFSRLVLGLKCRQVDCHSTGSSLRTKVEARA